MAAHDMANGWTDTGGVSIGSSWLVRMAWEALVDGAKCVVRSRVLVDWDAEDWVLGEVIDHVLRPWYDHVAGEDAAASVSVSDEIVGEERVANAGGVTVGPICGRRVSPDENAVLGRLMSVELSNESPLVVASKECNDVGPEFDAGAFAEVASTVKGCSVEELVGMATGSQL